MDGLVQWYGEQLDEDERIARAAGGDAWRRQGHPSETIAVYDSKGEPVVYDEGSPTEEQQAHIAEHDPARVLREIDGKRRVIAEWQEASLAARNEPSDASARVAVFAFGLAIRSAATVYVHRPGYLEKWQP